MTKKIIISLPKGRIRTDAQIFKEKGLNIKFEKGDRDLIDKDAKKIKNSLYISTR